MTTQVGNTSLAAWGAYKAAHAILMQRVGRDLGADFDIEQFAHRAFCNSAQGRIEMHVVSRRDRVIHVGGLPLLFAVGESIHTENSYKYCLPALNDLAEASRFAVERVWTEEHEYFSVAYLSPRRSWNDWVFPGRAGGSATLLRTKPFL